MISTGHDFKGEAGSATAFVGTYALWSGQALIKLVLAQPHRSPGAVIPSEQRRPAK